MQIIISGASGLIGTALTTRLQDRHDIVPLRRGGRSDGIGWDPDGGTLDPTALSGADAVVHLAGTGIADRRWSAAVKQSIRDSRVRGTGLLARSMAAAETPPPVLVCASAIGYYGDRGDTVLDEDSSAGEGFLSDVCAEWEAAAQPARDAGIRVVHLRIGVVLTAAGGALAQMLPPFKMGVGGVIGSGQQYMSWIALDDLTALFAYAIESPDLAGAVNAVAPTPVTNREFTKALGQALGRPTVFPLPGVVARLMFGEMADALLLASTRVVPARLGRTDFTFTHERLDTALSAALD